VLSWELSNTMETGFCLAALEAAFRFGQPEIWNSDQGSQFTSPDFLAPLKKRDTSISMDGRGRALDNVFVERLWRSLKYERIPPVLDGARRTPWPEAGLTLPKSNRMKARNSRSSVYRIPLSLMLSVIELCQLTGATSHVACGCRGRQRQTEGCTFDAYLTSSMRALIVGHQQSASVSLAPLMEAI
jgi:transposase InsO family protein